MEFRGFLALICIGMLAGCSASSESGKLEVGGTLDCGMKSFVPTSNPAPRLLPVGTCSVFAGFLVESLLAGGSGQYRGEPAVSEDLASGDSDSGGAESFTTTNVQEAGVDEPDFLKNDGSHIYVLSGRRLTIVKSWPAAELRKVGELTIDDYPTAMFLVGKRLAIISHLYPDNGDKGSLQEGGRAFSPTTRLSLVDVSDPAEPVIERTIDLEAWYQSARVVDGRLFFVGQGAVGMPSLQLAYDEPVAGGGSVDGSRGDADSGADSGSSEPWSPGFHMASALGEDSLRRLLAAAVAKTRFEDWLPLVRDSLTGHTSLLVDDFKSLYIPEVTSALGNLVVFSLDVSVAGAPLQKNIVESAGGVVYASSGHLIVGYGDGVWFWGAPVAVDTVDAVATDDDTAVSPAADSVDEGPRSFLQHFRLAEDGIRFAGSGVVRGWVDSPWRMSEHQGYLRVFSSSLDRNFQSDNHLSVFSLADGDLIEVGMVAGFAAEETIMSSRFVGDRAFASTYHWVMQFDPLFTFDLSDPTNPRIVGELVMPGYSAYLQALDDDYLLAVGMAAENIGSPVTNVSVSLYDVGDFAAPVTAHESVVATGESRSFTEAAASALAFTWFAPEKLFAFPVSIWDGGTWADSFNGLIAWRVDPAEGFTEVGRVDHRSFVSDEGWAPRDMRRGIFASGDGKTWLYAVSNAGITVHDVDALNETVAGVSLPTHEAYDRCCVGDDMAGSEPPEAVR